MAFYRSISRDFFNSEDIVILSPLARLLYIATWLEADREGRLVWRPKTLKLRYLPGDACDIEALAGELVQAGLVIPYGADGQTFAEIPSFTRHQSINNREAASVIPPRSDDATGTRGSRVGHASPRVEDATGTPLFNSGTPLVGEESKGEESKSTRRDASLDDVAKGFDAFWSLYPKKVSKRDAAKAWGKLKPDAKLRERMMQALDRQRRSEQWQRDGGKFVPNPATWLNGARWDDELPAAMQPMPPAMMASAAGIRFDN